LEALRRVTIEKEVDIFGFTEANTCWDVVSETNRLARRTRGWWEKCQWTLTHNRLEPHDNEKMAYQPGGTGILCINHAAHCTLRPGDDALGLGRWCWTRIQGLDGFVLRVISMYRPCRSNGPMTVYQQHIRRLTSLQRFECPKEAILVDLAKEIQTWQHEGDHVILLTDFNDDITDTSVRHWASNLGLVEVITWLHPTNPPPPINGVENQLTAFSLPLNYFHWQQADIVGLETPFQVTTTPYGWIFTYRKFARRINRHTLNRAPAA